LEVIGSTPILLGSSSALRPPLLAEANASTATGGATRSRKRQSKRQHIRGDSWIRQHAHYSWKPTPARPRGERPARGDGKTSASSPTRVEANASDPLAETAKQAPAHPWGLVETPARPILVEANASTATGGATRSRKRQNKRQHIRGDSWKRQHAHDHERNVRGLGRSPNPRTRGPPEQSEGPPSER
jgi:hypothetical protein